jgi:V8-like Glu-specific endopeptidase
MYFIRVILIFSFLIGSAFANNLNPRNFHTTVGLILQKKEFKTVCSGELLSPTVVVTAAHCLTDLVSVRVINNYQITRWQYAGIRGRSHFGIKWYQHPSYNGVNPGSVDLGIIILNQPFNPNLPFHALSIDPRSYLQNGDKLIRVGYGKRGNGNIRNIFNMSYDRPERDYAVANDTNGMGGDSGGPVFSLVDGVLSLVGIHCGRLTDNNGELLPLSYFQVIDQEMMKWIDAMIGIHNSI